MLVNRFAVSVVVPVYNGEKYIRRCVDSLLNQTLENIQIIIVNDASTDSTEAILSEYSNKNPEKVTVITLPENKKQGGARNAGLDLAEGEYIGFVDADDFVKNEMFERLYKKALTSDYDVVDSDYLIYDGERVLGKEISVNLDNLDNVFSNYGRLWTKIFKKHFFCKKALSIRFPENIFYEDNYIQFFLAAETKNMGKVNDAFYFYSHNPNSTTRVVDNPRYFDRFKTAVMAFEDFKRREDYTKYKDEINYRVYNLGVYITFLGLVNNHSQVPLDKIKEINNLNKQLSISKNKFYKKSSKKYKFFGFCILRFPYLFAFILYTRLKSIQLVNKLYHGK
ncbi:hypothetical protein CWC11_09535 [Pseudoalteromonas sp. S3178]|uniref:glycosyltransferase family 2 protein n=1 Tax=Pseudoalteromonas sp. S3178 TaxID=579532 RepID=UPI00110B0BDF|nr:glycosyltransferase family 2 protein [Pseudoalteromonas sp. S3178]TMP05564.1 hypothetical protein CWC11_09535 [Pseudoalteromonas sp. S3178]